MDPFALDRCNISKDTVLLTTGRPKDLLGRLLEALPVLGVRGRLPILHGHTADCCWQSRRVRPVAVRSTQRRQYQAGQEHFRLQQVGREVADRVEGRQVRLIIGLLDFEGPYNSLLAARGYGLCWE